MFLTLLEMIDNMPTFKSCKTCELESLAMMIELEKNCNNCQIQRTCISKHTASLYVNSVSSQVD